MIIPVAIAVCALLGVVFLLAALRSFWRHRALAGAANGIAGVLLIAVAAVFALLAAGLHSYHRLSAEQDVGEIAFSALGPQSFRASLRYSSAKADAGETFELRGDEWQIDARVLKWRAFANVLGFDTLYRLERLSGRYRNIDDERNAPRTVFELAPEQVIDIWLLARRYRESLPWVDALYGSATYLPMADGARYAITVSASGLVARPSNEAARDATGGWR
ncbi:MAG: cation/multidrug efflux pump [Burkholderiales bacterium]|nr:cation/multidrug efflux pump [Burkholderiales bacterium]